MFLNDILDMNWDLKDSGDNPFNYKNVPTGDELTRIDVDNLEQYNVDHPDSKSKKLSNLFGVCLSPWEWTWTEYKCRRSRLIGKVGILHHTLMVEDPIAQLNSIKDIPKEIQEVLSICPPRFYSVADIFTYRKDLGQIRLIGNMWNMYDNDGQILDICAPTSMYLDLSIESDFRGCIQLFQQLLSPSLFAFSLSHCKNIEIVTDPTDLSKSNIRRSNTNRSLLYQYKSVKLTDATQKKYQRGEPVDNTDHRSVSFHICKGQFRIYTPESPLFGKLVGKFWVPQHARGSKDVGTVVKNYIAKKA